MQPSTSPHLLMYIYQMQLWKCHWKFSNYSIDKCKSSSASGNNLTCKNLNAVHQNFSCQFAALYLITIWLNCIKFACQITRVSTTIFCGIASVFCLWNCCIASKFFLSNCCLSFSNRFSEKDKFVVPSAADTSPSIRGSVSGNLVSTPPKQSFHQAISESQFLSDTTAGVISSARDIYVVSPQ